MVQNGNVYIVYFIGNGKTKQQDLNYGHTKQNKQRAPIPKDVVKFLFYETHKPFHPLANFKNTPFMLSVSNFDLRFLGVSKASIFPLTIMETRSQYSASSI